MTQRLDPTAAAPELYRSLLDVEGVLRRSLDPGLRALVKLRVSMANGCAYCVDMHGAEGLAGGEPADRLLALAAWRESDRFSGDERAALALADAVTTLGPDGVSDEVWDAAAARFDDATLVALVGTIGMINLWNRMAVPLRLAPQRAAA